MLGISEYGDPHELRHNLIPSLGGEWKEAANWNVNLLNIVIDGDNILENAVMLSWLAQLRTDLGISEVC